MNIYIFTGDEILGRALYLELCHMGNVFVNQEPAAPNYVAVRVTDYIGATPVGAIDDTAKAVTVSRPIDIPTLREQIQTLIAAELTVPLRLSGKYAVYGGASVRLSKTELATLAAVTDGTAHSSNEGLRVEVARLRKKLKSLSPTLNIVCKNGFYKIEW